MPSPQGREIGRGRAPSRARRADYAVFPLEVFARDVVDGRHGYGDAFSLFFWRWVLLCRDCARGVGCRQARAGGCRLPRVVIVVCFVRSRSGRGWRGRNPFMLSWKWEMLHNTISRYEFNPSLDAGVKRQSTFLCTLRVVKYYNGP